MAPASADDLIAQWLQQDDVSGQTEEVRPDLNSITDEQWRDIFTISREPPDAAFGRLLVEYGGKSQKDIFPVWLALLTAAVGLLIGGITGSTRIRRQLRTLTAPVLTLSQRPHRGRRERAGDRLIFADVRLRGVMGGIV